MRRSKLHSGYRDRESKILVALAPKHSIRPSAGPTPQSDLEDEKANHLAPPTSPRLYERGQGSR
jgi:hypothetical protein